MMIDPKLIYDIMVIFGIPFTAMFLFAGFKAILILSKRHQNK